MNAKTKLTIVATGLFAAVIAASAQSPRSYAKDGKSAGGDKALPNCAIMDEPVSLAVRTDSDDGPVFFCCAGCIPKYKANPDKYAKRVAAQRKALAGWDKIQVTCPVSGKPTDSEVFTEVDGKKVYFCCKGCVGKYKSDPAKYAVALANSYSYQTKCPVMGEEIDPQASTTLATGETIYFCCKGCGKKLRANPDKYNKNLVAQGIVVDWDAVKKAEAAKGHGDDHSGHDH